MSDAEHLIENAIMAMEKYPYEEARRVFFETPINIMMAKDSGCPLDAVWEMAVYCDTTLRQDWKEKWEDETAELINRQKAEIERLKAENGELRLKMSYMKEPNTIGDIHEMGAW